MEHKNNQSQKMPPDDRVTAGQDCTRICCTHIDWVEMVTFAQNQEEIVVFSSKTNQGQTKWLVTYKKKPESSLLAYNPIH